VSPVAVGSLDAARAAARIVVKLQNHRQAAAKLLICESQFD
jgi:hypothetical protein